MKAIVIGIMPQEKIRERLLSIARGAYKSKPGNLSHALKTMSNYGFVEMKHERNFVRPIAKATEFRIVA